MISKLKYYFSLAIKKPHLILSFIYKKHLGVIISIPIQSTIYKEMNGDVQIVKTYDLNEISKFYKRMKRNSITINQIKDWQKQGADCFLVYYKRKKVIGGMWIFKKEFELNNTSGKTLSANKSIRLDQDSIYAGNVIIDKNFRGKGINQNLLDHIIKFYNENSNYKNIIIITGASNGAYIRSTMKVNADLIGITQVINILGIKFRKEIFLDVKGKKWNN